MTKIRSKTVLAAALMVPLAFSAVSSAARAADLLTSWQATRGYDPAFAAARDALTAGAEKSKQGDALILPQVTLSGNADHLNERFRAGGSGAADSTLSGSRSGVGVSLAQPVFDAAAFVTRDQFRKQSLEAQVQYQAAEQDLILRVAKAYFEVLLARENVELVEEQEKAVGGQLARAKKTFEVGVSTITDTNEAQARFDAIIAADIAARNDLEIKETAYKRLTGLDGKQLVPISERPPTSPDPATLDAWMARVDNNLSIRAAALGLEIAQIDIQRYRLVNSPVLSFVASYAHRWDSGGISSSGGRDRTGTGTIGLQLSIPLFTGGARSSLLRQAVALRDQQSHTLDATKRDSEQAVQQFFLNVESGAAQIRALEQARVSSQSLLASSKTGRDVGVRTTIDVLNAQQAYYQTLYNLVGARYTYLYSRLQLAAAVGGLDGAELEKVNGWLAGSAPGSAGTGAAAAAYPAEKNGSRTNR